MKERQTAKEVTAEAREVECSSLGEADTITTKQLRVVAYEGETYAIDQLCGQC